MKLAEDMPWPPTPGEPYVVEDLMGSFTEVVEPGAIEGARQLPAEDRAFVVAEDEWNADFSVRRIKEVSAISGAIQGQAS